MKTKDAHLLVILLLALLPTQVNAQFEWLEAFIASLLGFLCSLPLLEWICADNDDGGAHNTCASQPNGAAPALLQGVCLPTISADTIRQTYSSCDDLSADLRVAALYLVENAIESNIQWYFHNNWNYNQGGGFRQPVDVAIPMPGAPEDANDGANDIPTNENSYGTNNQVEGVDEADLLKSNGEQAFVAYGREIIELDVEQNEISRTSLPDTSTPNDCGGSNGGSIDGMLLIDERLIVFAREYSYYYYYCGGQEEEDGTSRPIVQGSGATKVHTYDTTSMELLSTQELTGDYISARSIANNVYVVTKNWMDYHQFLQYFYPHNQDVFGTDFTEDQYRARAEAEAERRVDAFVDQLITELDDCDTLQQIALLQNTADALGFSGIMESLVNVHSFSVDNGTRNTRSMMLPSTGWHVYASQGYLVLAGEGYTVEADDGDGDESRSVGQRTYIIVYELDGASIADVKIGSVPGYALNQFAIDQHRQVDPVRQTEVDYLRIATCTRQRWWWGPGPAVWEPMDEALCEVNVLEISDEMPIVGTEDALGKSGERIYSVRFQGDRGFVVTFRETDPFYALDLSDPTNPYAAGELEIPGFSNYLHPFGDNHVLGVGQAVEDGVTVGLQISLFDVSDLANPDRIWNYIEASSSYSNAQYDHRSWRLLPESGILILPLTIYGDYGENNGLDGFRLYSVDESTGIEPYLTIEHAAGEFFYNGCWSQSGYLVPRSIVVGGGLHTFKAHTIVAYNLSDRTQVGLPINLDEGLQQDVCGPYFFEDLVF